MLSRIVHSRTVAQSRITCTSKHARSAVFQSLSGRTLSNSARLNHDAANFNPANLVTPQLGSLKLPKIECEPFKHYAPGSEEKNKLKAAIDELRVEFPKEIPCVINGQEVKSGNVVEQICPFDKNVVVARYHEATTRDVDNAIEGAMAARHAWESLPVADRCAIFLKAADLVTGKYGYRIMAATMLGQGKTAWQAEIEAWAELADFFRFNAYYMKQIYEDQPPCHSQYVWNRVEYRGLEGFVLGVSPFNFTAIAGNIPGAPAIMGNVVVWKPAPAAMLSNYLVYQLMMEAGVPKGVIQFVPGSPENVVQRSLKHTDFAGLHFTGSSEVFKTLWKDISSNLETYKSFPRIVGETGGKNAHLVHTSADPDNVINQTVRAAFEYQGQKCSACSRLYIPESMWNSQVKDGIVKHLSEMRLGDPTTDFTNFMSGVITKQAFEKIRGFIERAKQDKDVTVVAGGVCDDSKGWFVHPTVLETRNPHSETMENEIFGPVLTVYVYPDNQFEQTVELASRTSKYGLTCGVFAKDRYAINAALNLMRHGAGNMYVNDKCTGAVVGQQPFGGARLSGTNDKAGYHLNLMRWTSARTIKENFVPISDYRYPSNQEA